MSKHVLDASAVTAVLRKEPGYENVIPHLRGSLISSVNLVKCFAPLEAMVHLQIWMSEPFS